MLSGPGGCEDSQNLGVLDAVGGNYDFRSNWIVRVLHVPERKLQIVCYYNYNRIGEIACILSGLSIVGKKNAAKSSTQSIHHAVGLTADNTIEQNHPSVQYSRKYTTGKSWPDTGVQLLI